MASEGKSYRHKGIQVVDRVMVSSDWSVLGSLNKASGLDNSHGIVSSGFLVFLSLVLQYN